MKVYLTNATKKRVIKELKKILYDHPRYRADSENVQNKFAFSERPQRGIIVNGTSADRVRLSADNYVGRLSSFVMLTQVDNHPFTSIEWVRENYALLEQYSPKRDIFPTPPGAYVIEITRLPDEARNVPGLFTIDPYVKVDNEPLIMFSSSLGGEAQLSHDNVYQDSLRLWLNGRRALLKDVDYSIDYQTGSIEFLKPTPTGSFVHADYMYRTDIQGPFPFFQETSDATSIPGVILAFGDRAQLGDKLAVMVYDRRTDSCDIYGGKFEVNFELVVFSRDSEDREKMVDYVITSVLNIQNRLGYEGIELLDISPGGESEDVYNAEIDDYYYETSVSLGLRVDWETYISLPVEIWRTELTSKEAETVSGYLDGSVPVDNIKVLEATQTFGMNTTIGRSISYDRVR